MSKQVKWTGIIMALVLQSGVVQADITVCSTGADETDAAQGLIDLTPGEDLLLCAGETHDMGGYFRTLGDMQGSVVTSYGTGTMPVVTGQKVFADNAPKNLTFQGLNFQGADPASPATNGHAFRFNDGSENITVRDSIIENFTVGVYTQGNNNVGIQTNIHIINNIIRNNYAQGVLGGGPGYIVRGNTLTNNGNNGIFDHNVYLGGCKPLMTSNGACHMIVEDNYIENSSPDINGNATGSEIVLHGYVTKLDIKNNVIKSSDGANPTNYGVDVSALTDTDEERWYDVTVEGNHFIGLGRNAISIEGTDGVSISGNVFSRHNPANVGRTTRSIRVRTGPEINRGGITTTNVNIGVNTFDTVPSETWVLVESDVAQPISVATGLPAPVLSYMAGEYSTENIIGMDVLCDLMTQLNTSNNTYDINRDGFVLQDDLALLLNYIDE